MNEKAGKTTVVLLGTMHLEPEAYPCYARRLGEIIEKIRPTIICSEVSPEQLSGSQPCNSKPEQRDVVLPAARRLGIPVVPIQPATAAAIEWEKRYRAADSALRNQEPHCHYLEYGERLAGQEAALWGELMKGEECIENVQMTEYHVFSQARDLVEGQLLPEREKLLEDWNESFLRKIEETIEGNRGSLILVVAGLWHKYWLWNRLSARDDIDVHNLQSYRKTACTQR